MALFEGIQQYITENADKKRWPDKIEVSQISTIGTDWEDCSSSLYPSSKRKVDEYLKATGMYFIRLDDCYRVYAGGVDSYNRFIDDIRRSTC